MTASRPILRIRSPVVGRNEVVFEITSPRVTIGRGDRCDVVLLEQAASRLHAEIRATEHGYVLFDAGSHNGVWIDGHRVVQHVLRDGDSFRIGESTLQLVVHPHAQPTYVPDPSPPPRAPASHQAPSQPSQRERPPSFVWSPPQQASSAPTFFGDLADVPDHQRPVEDEPLPRVGPWVALFVVLVLALAGIVAYAFGLRIG